MTIYFLKDWTTYRKGEVAIITPKRGKWLVDKGYAVIHRNMTENTYGTS